MISLQQLHSVFPLPPPLPEDGDPQIAAQWLFNHNHTEPSQRTRAALKHLAKQHLEWLLPLVQQYALQIMREVEQVDVASLERLAMIRDYFAFPLYYLDLPDKEALLIERTINTAIKSKITELPRELTTEHSLFLESIGWDLTDANQLNYELALTEQVQQYARFWEESILDKIDLNEFSMQELSKLRINELFDIVINFPDSTGALNDLRNSISPSQRAQLVNVFVSECTKRLLHAGANTDDIILCYTSTIKSFLLIDPRGVLLDNASRPIRRYLKERDDTIPTIVNALLGDSEENQLFRLSDELIQESEKQVNDLTLDWVPDPIDALPDFRKQDIIESLISIFDPKDSIISELASAFAKRLLESPSYQIEGITQKLNQLKSKFEEHELNDMDVMVKDILESEITNRKIHEECLSLSENLRFKILSYLYWPEFQEYTFKLPEQIQSQIDQYFEEFSKIKAGRSLKWVNSGLVTIELELNNKLIEFEVTPDKAAVISQFQDQQSSTLPEISASLEMDDALSLSALKYWVRVGVLSKHEDSYIVLEDHVPTEPIIEQTEDSKNESQWNYETCWPYIAGMLKNLGSLDAERIQSFLEMVILKEKAYNGKLGDLELFLRKCVLDDRLELEQGSYKLKQKK